MPERRALKAMISLMLLEDAPRGLARALPYAETLVGTGSSRPAGQRAEDLALRAHILFGLGRRAGGERALKDAMGLDARRACEGSYPFAPSSHDERYFALCLARFPEDPGLLVDRGVGRYQRADAQGAERDFSQALAAHPDCLEAALSLAFLTSAADPAGALRVLDSALASRQAARETYERAEAMSRAVRARAGGRP